MSSAKENKLLNNERNDSKFKSRSWEDFANDLLNEPSFYENYIRSQRMNNSNSNEWERFDVEKEVLYMRMEMLQLFLASLIDFICIVSPSEISTTIRIILNKFGNQLGLFSPSLASSQFAVFRNAFISRMVEILKTKLHIGSLPQCHTSPVLLTTTSRFKSEFEKCGVIGKGGFGKVYVVRSRLDSRIYAIKKIIVSSMKVDQLGLINLSSEVRMLASLRHNNIVRYHSSWVEVDIPDEESEKFKNEAKLDGDDNFSNSAITGENEEKTNKENGQKKVCGNGEFDDGEIMNNSSKNDWLEDSKISKSSEKSSEHLRGRFWDPVSSNISALDSRSRKTERKISEESSEAEVGALSVYLVMELCEMSLTEYLRKRNDIYKQVDWNFNLKIMKQLLSALAYVHTQNIIHRDVKPGNIFLEDHAGPRPRLILGDFGLACEHSYRYQRLGKGDGIKHSAGVGTSVYSAPEQLHSSNYDFSVDIYSSGIVFFELFKIVGTEMERAEHIDKLRSCGECELSDVPPKMKKLIEDMCNHEREIRPTANGALERLTEISIEDENTEQIIKVDTIHDYITELEDVKYKLKTLTDERDKIKTENNLLKEEINFLLRKIESLEVKDDVA